MVVAQAPAGPTTHEVWVGNGSGTRTLHKRLVDVYSEDGQTLRVTLDPPRIAKEVLILTVDSPQLGGLARGARVRLAFLLFHKIRKGLLR